MWQLPLFADYRRLIDSNVADIKNIGERYGGAITAALFLAEFVGDMPWVHLDIAGPAFSEKGDDLGPKGATGVPVRTLVRYLAATRARRSRGARRHADAPDRPGARASSRTPTTPRSPRAARSRSGRGGPRGAPAGPHERRPRLGRPRRDRGGAGRDTPGGDARPPARSWASRARRSWASTTASSRTRRSCARP